eukprot:359154-Chlamydomonas_euryale.AAC.6
MTSGCVAHDGPLPSLSRLRQRQPHRAGHTALPPSWPCGTIQSSTTAPPQPSFSPSQQRRPRLHAHTSTNPPQRPYLRCCNERHVVHQSAGKPDDPGHHLCAPMAIGGPTTNVRVCDPPSQAVNPPHSHTCSVLGMPALGVQPLNLPTQPTLPILQRLGYARVGACNLSAPTTRARKAQVMPTLPFARNRGEWPCCSASQLCLGFRVGGLGFSGLRVCHCQSDLHPWLETLKGGNECGRPHTRINTCSLPHLLAGHGGVEAQRNPPQYLAPSYPLPPCPSSKA